MWIIKKIGRVHEAQGQCQCTHAQRAHLAAYRAESVNEHTGEMRVGWLCTNRAAELASQHGIPWPLAEHGKNK